MNCKFALKIVSAFMLLTAVAACGGGGGDDGSSSGNSADPGAGFNKARGPSGTVSQILPARDGSGDLFIAGFIKTYDDSAVSHLVRLDADANLDAGFVTGSGFNNSILVIAPASDGSGDILAGGFFTTYDGVTANYLVRLNADGSRDAGFDIGAGFDSAVRAIAPARDGSGDYYVGGDFQSYDGVTVNGLVRLNSDGSIDPGFATGTGFDSTVWVLVPARDGSGDIYAGGSFTSYDGVSVNRIARLDADGGLDAGFASGTGFDGLVLAATLAGDGSGDIYVGGMFGSYDGSTANGIVRLDADGSLDAAFISGSGFDEEVDVILPDASGSGAIYVGGYFSSYDGTSVNGLVRLNADGSLDGGHVTGIGFNDGVQTIVPVRAGSSDVYAGGEFTGYDGVTVNRIARLDAGGSLDTGFLASGGLDARVTPITPAGDGSGDVFVGGNFTSFGAVTANRLARLTADGRLAAGFTTGSGFEDDVEAITPAGDGSGDVYVGGRFTTYDGSPANRLLRLDADGGRDAAFDTGGNLNGHVKAVVHAGDGSGDIIVGGDFTLYGAVTANRLARLNADGSLDTGFVTGSGFDAGVGTIALAGDGSGDIYVGGDFTSYDGASINRVVRLNADGSLDSGFIVGGGFDGEVHAIAPADDGSGDVYVGGDFSSYQGLNAMDLVRLNADGSLDSGFATGNGFVNGIRAIVPAGDGSGGVYVGGNFTSYNGADADGLLRLNADGSIDAAFTTGRGFDDDVLGMALAGDGSGDLFVGGRFSRYRDSTVDWLVRLDADGSLD